MNTKTRIVLLALFAILILIQFIRPEQNIEGNLPDQDFLEYYEAPAEISNLIRTSCYDCHSNETDYPWYARVAPVSWWIADHIREGKEELNLGEWFDMPVRRKAHKMEEAAEYVENHEMPLPSYLWMHSEAKLTDKQRKELIEFFALIRLKESGEPIRIEK